MRKAKVSDRTRIKRLRSQVAGLTRELITSQVDHAATKRYHAKKELDKPETGAYVVRRGFVMPYKQAVRQ